MEQRGNRLLTPGLSPVRAAGGEGVAPGLRALDHRGAPQSPPHQPRRVARGRGGHRLAGGHTGGAGGGGAEGRVTPQPGLGLSSSSLRPARESAATARTPPAATMSTGLRYKSKLATPGEPGARPRARARLCPRRPPASHRVSPSLPRPVAWTCSDLTATPTPQKTSRYVHSTFSSLEAQSSVTYCGINASGVQARPRPRQPPSSPVAIIDNHCLVCRRGVPLCLELQRGGGRGQAWPSDPHSRALGLSGG